VAGEAVRRETSISQTDAGHDARSDVLCDRTVVRKAVTWLQEKPGKSGSGGLLYRYRR
jgi:hypothetical protein